MSEFMDKPIIEMDRRELTLFIEEAARMGKWFENLAKQSYGRLAIDARVRAGSWWYRRNCAVQRLYDMPTRIELDDLPY